MILITPNPTFKTDCEIKVAGEKAPAIINVTFKYLNRDQVAAWEKKHHGQSNLEALSALITNWSGVQTPEGEEVPYSEGALQQLITAYHSADKDLIQTFLYEVLGARLKN